jgi:hypothetical protein
VSYAAWREFQHEFSLALMGDDWSDARGDRGAGHLSESLHLRAHPAFAVYRNTVAKGCVDALEANFPSVVRLVGRAWFRSVAALYARDMPPRDPRLLHYGRDFPAFIARQPAAANLPYLADVASLDRCWIDCHVAADAPALPAERLAAMAPDELGRIRLVPHPAARWRWHAEMPVFSIWSRNREEDAAPQATPEAIAWQAEGVLLTRPGGDVQWCALTQGACALLNAVQRGNTLAEAAQAALAAEPACDLAATLALLLTQGAFAD